MLANKLKTLSFLSIFIALSPAFADDTKIYQASELDFRNVNGEEIVYYNNQPFFGAVILTDNENRETTYLYRKGKKSGVAISRYEDGKIELETNYRRGMKNGEEILFYENGQPSYKKTYKDNVLHGDEVLFYENGRPMQHNIYSNGKLDGEIASYDKNGNPTLIVSYKDGLKNGSERIIANGTLMEEKNYVDDIQDGVSKKYNGKYLIEESMYKDGKKNGISKNYMENGSWTEIPYVDGKKSGVGKAFYPNKKIANKAVYLNDEKNGFSEKYYNTGLINAIETFKNNKLEGIARYFNPQGELKSVSYYIQGTEMAKIDISKNSQLNDIYEAYKEGKISQYTSRKNLWYQILWLGLSTGKQDILEALEKDMKMYSAEISDIKIYERETKSYYAKYNREMFFGLNPLSYAINLASPVEILQLFAIDKQNIEAKNPRGSTALIEAIRLNNLDMVKYLLLQKADVTQKYENDTTVLLYAIEEGVQPEILEELINAGADVNAIDKNKNSPITLAIDKQDAKLIQMLVEHNADIANQMSADGKPLLFYAYDKKLPANILDIFLKSDIEINQRDNEGNLLILLALENNDKEMVQKLLEKNADVNLTDNKKENAISYVLDNPAVEQMIPLIFSQDIDVKNDLPKYEKPLWLVLYENDRLDLLKIVLDKMQDVETVDTKGRTPLYTILEHPENEEAVDLVLSYINKVDNKLLWTAVKSKNLSLFRKVIEKGANINALNSDNVSLLHYLINNNYSLDFIEAIEKSNLNINKRDAENHTALFTAIKNKNLKLAENLLKHGADANEVWDEENYLMMIDDDAEMTNILLEFKTDISHLTSGNQTVLMKAIEKLNMTLISHIFEQKVHLQLRDSNGKSALLYLSDAVAKNTNVPSNILVEKVKTIAKLFIDNGIDINTQNANGETVLMLIAKTKTPHYYKLSKALIELGLNPDLTDQYGNKAEDYLKEKE